MHVVIKCNLAYRNEELFFTRLNNRGTWILDYNTLKMDCPESFTSLTNPVMTFVASGHL